MPSIPGDWFREMAELAGEGFFLIRIDPDVGTEFVSPSLLDLLGDPTADDIVRALDAADVQQAIQAGIGLELEVRCPAHDGPPVRLNVRARRRVREDGSTVLEGTARDVTELRAAERGQAEELLAASEAHFRLIAENSSDVIVRIAREGSVVEWISPSITQMTGWAPEDWIGHPVTDFAHPDDLQRFANDRAKFRAGELPVNHGSWVARSLLREKDGSYHWIETHTRAIFDHDKNRDGAILTFRIVDKEVAADEELARRARLDDLTGLLTRRAVLSQLDGADAPGPSSTTGALFIDVDSFKTANDEHGHAAGDALLQALAGRIRDAVGPDGSVARMGGDEFLVILGGVQSLEDVLELAERIRTTAAEPVTTPSARVRATVSIGATLRRSGESADALIARADQAMYSAKRRGRNRVVAGPS